MFYGRAVRVAMNGKEFDAIVYQEHHGLESHKGAKGEPLVHVIFADPNKEHLNLADPMAKNRILHDVAHASHEFTTPEHVERYGYTLEGARYHESRSPLEVMKEVAEAREKRLAEEAEKNRIASEAAAAKTPSTAGAATDVDPNKGSGSGSVN